ncbi:DUF3040 domain-containing protein [Nonomuraea cavernae]|uniref:DUF3040 domain-containing protein n=1 Tax=Nonomuraea cavernae TaxID=2045107 RepID=A0A917YRH9_9ACTN|nr:DUF3040 domain-containing protein [Nonomuraea cavernae]MCA2183725.1 DUF3040 domain-containing protein [Nonomuraea cavernae]GGO61174.1 hypothetical protein GCM10012289_02780 [Nonomuraea cavernae]
MSLSHRERRILAEIELGLRECDQAFARRIDALNAAAEEGPRRFSSHVSGMEMVCVLIAALLLAVLPVIVVLHAGRACPTPARTGSSSSGAPYPAPNPPPASARSDSCR